MEDFITFPIVLAVIVLLLLSQCQRAKEDAPSFNLNFLLLTCLFVLSLTSVGESQNLFHAIRTMVESSPNRAQALEGVDK